MSFLFKSYNVLQTFERGHSHRNEKVSFSSMKEKFRLPKLLFEPVSFRTSIFLFVYVMQSLNESKLGIIKYIAQLEVFVVFDYAYVGIPRLLTLSSFVVPFYHQQRDFLSLQVDDENLPDDFVYVFNNLECQSQSFDRSMTVSTSYVYLVERQVDWTMM